MTTNPYMPKYLLIVKLKAKISNTNMIRMK